MMGKQEPCIWPLAAPGKPPKINIFGGYSALRVQETDDRVGLWKNIAEHLFVLSHTRVVTGSVDDDETGKVSCCDARCMRCCWPVDLEPQGVGGWGLAGGSKGLEVQREG